MTAAERQRSVATWRAMKRQAAAGGAFGEARPTATDQPRHMIAGCTWTAKKGKRPAGGAFGEARPDAGPHP